MIYTIASGNVRTEKKQEADSFMIALKEARATNKAMASSGKTAGSQGKDYIGPVELLFIPS